MMNFEQPYEEYSKYEAEIFLGTKPLKKTKIKCLLWLPKNTMGEPHFYLFLENFEEYTHFEKLIDKRLRIIDLKINDILMDGTIHQKYVIKKAYFSSSKARLISKDWHEAFIKYHFPKFVLTTLESEKENDKFRFFISESKLLTTILSTQKHYTGEIKRDIISKILIEKEVAHLGIKSIETDRYIEQQKANILEITPNFPINSMLTFYKRVKPIVDFILLLTSFAERRRLNWNKCDGFVGDNYTEIYNTRTTFYQDKETTLLISRFEFENFLKASLQNIKFEDIGYMTKLLRSYLSGIDYSANAKIVLWNSLLELVLKRKFGKKRDEFKADLLREMHIYTSDLMSIKDLIDIRNDVAHGDDIKPEKLFSLMEDWEILIERVLLAELQWSDLSKTDVGIDGIKPYGL